MISLLYRRSLAFATALLKKTEVLMVFFLSFYWLASSIYFMFQGQCYPE